MMHGTPMQPPMGMSAMMPMGTQPPMMGSMPGPYNGMPHTYNGMPGPYNGMPGLYNGMPGPYNGMPGPYSGIPLMGSAFGSIPRSHVGDGSGTAQ